MKTRSWIVLLTALPSLWAWAQNQVLVEQSEVRFAGKQMNVPAEGRFKKFNAEVSLDPNKPESARAQLEVDLNSIDLNSDEVETEIKRKLWFDTASFPKAKFVSGSIKAVGTGRYEMSGRLTIKGVTRDVVVPFTLKRDSKGIATAEGAFDIKRLDFKVGEDVWADTDTVANEVQIRFKIVLSGISATR